MVWAWQGFRIRGLWYPTPSRRHPDPVAPRVAQEIAHRVFNAGGRHAANPSRRHREAMFYVELLAEGGAVGSAGVALWRRMRRWRGHRPAVRRCGAGWRCGCAGGAWWRRVALWWRRCGAKPMAQKNA